LISVDWTKDGYYYVLEASLVLEGRAIPFYCLAVHRDELKGRPHDAGVDDVVCADRHAAGRADAGGGGGSRLCQI
jgi:hypothetical protein